GPLALPEPGRVGRQRAGPEGAVLDEDAPRALAVGVELDAVAGAVEDFAVADDDGGPAAGDAVGVVLVLEGGVEQVVDLAVVDRHVLAEDADAVARRVADLAVAQRHAVGRDLHPVAAAPVAVHQIVLVHARSGDLQALDPARPVAAADRPLDADGP